MKLSEKVDSHGMYADGGGGWGVGAVSLGNRMRLDSQEIFFNVVNHVVSMIGFRDLVNQ